MFNAVLASVALLASTALAQGPGSAIVVNKCNYNVYLQNTPASGGGYDNEDRVLSPGGSYSQTFIELKNLMGWSIKLSDTANSFGTNILQYEYTYLTKDPVIWFDLSAVDGNPWDGNWEITGSPGCTPKQAAYRFSTDDAYGMQDCPVSSAITVTLCSGTSGGAAPSSPAESAPPAGPTSEPAPAPTSAAPPAPTESWGNTWNVGGKNVETPAGDAVADKKLPSPTTLATSPADAWDGPAVTVTNLHYETVTQTVTAAAHKRHVHHPRHAHHHA